MSKPFVSDTKLQYTLNKLKTILDKKYKPNNPTINILRNGVLVGDFSLNQLASKDINILVPIVDYEMSDTSRNAIQNSTVKKYIDDAVKDISGITFDVVDELPSTGKTGVIYLVPSSSTMAQDVYNEYIWLSEKSAYERIGSTSVDLTGYLNENDEITETQIDTIFTAVFDSAE